MSIKIISGHSIFNENAVVLSKKYNWKIETDFDPQPKDLYIVYGAHELAHQLLEVQFRKNNSFGYVILNSEQSHSQFMKNKYYLSLMKRNIVFDFNTLTADYLKESFQIKVLAYHYFEFMKFNQESEERKYDITFIGTKSDKRTDIINSLKEKYPNLSFFVDMDWQHSASDKLTTVLQQSKIVLNIPYHENNALETHRINKAISCGCKVVSLRSCDDDANDFYKEYVTFAEDMLEVDFNNLEEKKTYEELIKSLTQKISGHFLFMIEHIHKKLLSINNKDEPTNQVVCEQAAAATDDTADQAEEIVLGEQVGEGVSVC
jgi:hypothetical protein